MRQSKTMLILFSLVIATQASAADTIILPAKNGGIPFNHRKHAEMSDSWAKRCTTCHPTMEGGKIPGFGKDMAHKNCRGCHEEKKTGPTKCRQCHRRL